MDWFLRSYLRRHLMGKPVLSLQIIGCFFRLAFDMLPTFYRLKSQNYRFSTDLKRREKINFSLLVFTFGWARYNAYCPRNFLILSQVPCHILWIHLCSCHAFSQALFLPAPTETRWSELINIIRSRQDKKRINKWRQRGEGGGGEAEERGREERTNSYLPLSFFPTFLCVFLLNFLGVFQAHHLKGSWAEGYSFRIPSIDKWYPFFVHSVEIRTFSRLFQSLKILLLALLGLSISFWNGSFPNPPFVYCCTSNSEIYAPSYVYLNPVKGNPIGRSELPRVNYYRRYLLMKGASYTWSSFLFAWWTEFRK